LQGLQSLIRQIFNRLDQSGGNEQSDHAAAHDITNSEAARGANCSADVTCVVFAAPEIGPRLHLDHFGGICPSSN
jgi:hypothetical protein